jgi:hypothetical protein
VLAWRFGAVVGAVDAISSRRARTARVWLSTLARVLVTLALALAPAALHAQSSEAAQVTAAAGAPGVIHLAPLALPVDAPLPNAPFLDVLAVIDPAGVAHLDQNLAPESLRAAAEQALAHSQFRPAQARAVAVQARVRVRLLLLSPQAPPLDAEAPAKPRPSEPPQPQPTVSVSVRPSDAAAASAPPAAAASVPRDDSLLSFGASGRTTALLANDRRLELQEMRNLPGAFGDPFRVLDALPGVVPQLSGLPYVYVRGAPPAGTVYYYDGIQVPGMFHLALGPAVVHPALIDEVNFFPSVAPARFGRFTGGVLSGGPSPRPPPDRVNGELELRLIDLTGKIEVPVAGGSLSLSGRYGYPGPVISLFSPRSSLDYWDYQARLRLPISALDRFELVWLGSYDLAGFEDSLHVQRRYVLEFHRAEARLIRTTGPYELGAALQGGFERSQIDTTLRVRAVRIGPRVWASYRGPHGVRARVGADLFGSTGRLYAASATDDGPLQIRVPFAEGVAARSAMGAYLEIGFDLTDRLRTDLGVRSDLWLTGHRSEAAVDPRLTLTYRSHDAITWHGAVGLAHQPSVFLIPLPGISEVGLESGLQSAIQSEAGVSFDLPNSFKFDTQVYLQHFSNMILPELAIDQTNDCASLAPEVEKATARCNGGYPRSSTLAYGLELFLRRSVTENLSGWINYTLGRALAQTDAGVAFRPTFDVRHVLNLVLQYRLGLGFSTGGRVQFRSGKPASHLFLRETEIRYEQRLAGFFRADLHISYDFRPSWGALRLTLEWFNVTLSREETDIICRDGVGVGSDPLAATPCRVQRAPALFFPNVGVRAEF